jgi:NAD(P)-dependent dehydrogenase (short-subunit alcohol dehydrogenase family)
MAGPDDGAGWRDVPSQDGRRFVVTGASGGLGAELVRVLAGRGARVVLAVRSLEKGETLARTIDGDVEVRRLDVADLSSVAEFAEDLGPVDVLINNAGVLALPFGLSPDGVELHFATNYLGHFALTSRLLPQLTDRVVVVGSAAHRRGELDLADLRWERRGYQPFAAYAASKLANLLFLAELQRRLTAAGSTLRATGGHPGSTATGITGNTGSRLKTFVGEFGHKLVGMAAWQGALPILYAATMDVPGNSYFGPHRLREMSGWPTGVGRSRAAIDPDLAGALWEESERLCGVTFPL